MSDTTSGNNNDPYYRPKKKREYNKPFVNTPRSRDYGVSELVAKSRKTRPSVRAVELTSKGKN